MPRSDQKSFSLNREIAVRWKKVAGELGYGERGMQKFLMVVLEIAESHPTLFKKRT